MQRLRALQICKPSPKQVGRPAWVASSARPGLDALLDREWLLQKPDTKVKTIAVEGGSFSLLQDDLLHPVMGGNKMRKLDALMPAIHAGGYTDVVTCGGLQSAHTAAVAAACAERGMRCHLLVRGEAPRVPTGYHLYARMLGHVTYVPRSEYADRQGMMQRHLQRVSEGDPGAKVFMLAEGAADPLALLGSVRLIRHLADASIFPTDQPCSLVVDSGTGTTAVVTVMLAGSSAYYAQQQAVLTAAFSTSFAGNVPDLAKPLPLRWVERGRPRSFGKVFPEEIATCSQIAKQHGVLLDPIYTLAAWEAAESLAQSHEGARLADARSTIGMLHTGGGSGLHGLAQRFPDCF